MSVHSNQLASLPAHRDPNCFCLILIAFCHYLYLRHHLGWNQLFDAHSLVQTRRFSLI